MAKILPFQRPPAGKKNRGNTLCRTGHHKWALQKDTVFDSKQGKLVSLYRCIRCNATRVRAD